MQWAEVSKQLFYIGWGCIGIWAAKSINEMAKSLGELNIKMAVVIERQGSQERTQENHERRLERLEDDQR